MGQVRTSNKLCYIGSNPNARLAKGKQVVNERSDARKDNADEPSPNGRNRHAWVVGRIDDSANLHVGRVFRGQYGLQLHDPDCFFVLLLVGGNVVNVSQKVAHLLPEITREVGVVSVHQHKLADDRDGLVKGHGLESSFQAFDLLLACPQLQDSTSRQRQRRPVQGTLTQSLTPSRRSSPT